MLVKDTNIQKSKRNLKHEYINNGIKDVGKFDRASAIEYRMYEKKGKQHQKKSYVCLSKAMDTILWPNRKVVVSSPPGVSDELKRKETATYLIRN